MKHFTALVYFCVGIAKVFDIFRNCMKIFLSITLTVSTCEIDINCKLYYHICCCMPCCGFVLLQCHPCSNRSISPTRRAHSSKPAARCCSGRMGQTDRQTNTMPLHGLCCTYYVGSANNYAQVWLVTFSIARDMSEMMISGEQCAACVYTFK